MHFSVREKYCNGTFMSCNVGRLAVRKSQRCDVKEFTVSLDIVRFFSDPQRHFSTVCVQFLFH